MMSRLLSLRFVPFRGKNLYYSLNPRGFRLWFKASPLCRSVPTVITPLPNQPDKLLPTQLHATNALVPHSVEPPMRVGHFDVPGFLQIPIKGQQGSFPIEDIQHLLVPKATQSNLNPKPNLTSHCRGHKLRVLSDGK